MHRARCHPTRSASVGVGGIGCLSARSGACERRWRTVVEVIEEVVVHRPNHVRCSQYDPRTWIRDGMADHHRSTTVRRFDPLSGKPFHDAVGVGLAAHVVDAYSPGRQPGILAGSSSEFPLLEVIVGHAPKPTFGAGAAHRLYLSTSLVSGVTDPHRPLGEVPQPAALPDRTAAYTVPRAQAAETTATTATTLGSITPQPDLAVLHELYRPWTGRMFGPGRPGNAVLAAIHSETVVSRSRHAVSMLSPVEASDHSTVGAQS
jgi:hypothetical protein